LNQLTAFEQFERILRHVSKSLAERDWETPAMQILDELAEEFRLAVLAKADNEVAAALSFGA
jgi:histone H3/H4